MVFTHRNFYTQKLLHREVFAQRRLDMKSQVEIGSSSSGKTLGRSFRALTCSPKKPSISNKVPIPWFFFKKRDWQQFFGKNPWQELSGTHLLPKKAVYFQQSSYSMIFFKKRKEYMSEAGPHPKAFQPPHCDEMEGREIRRSRWGALALKYIYIHDVAAEMFICPVWKRW